MRGKRERFLKRTRERVAEALKSRDMLIAQTARVITELDEVLNLISGRLKEWYGVYFPEMKVDDQLGYAKLVLVLNKENPDIEKIIGAVGKEIGKKVIESTRQSLGAPLTEDDLAECKAFAQQFIALYEFRTRCRKYQEKLGKEICPNLTAVAGADIAAKLIAHVGSLNRLAVLPASTIQVLGAEKALFKHLKNRKIAPPKHGLIFQHPRISSSPKAVRGKIARALANKLALAAKADAFTKNFIGEKLKKDFDEQYDKIVTAYRTKKG